MACFLSPNSQKKTFQQSPQSITPRTPRCLFIWLLCCLKLVAFASRQGAPTIRLKWRHFLQLRCHPSFQRPPLQHEADFCSIKKVENSTNPCCRSFPNIRHKKDKSPGNACFFSTISATDHRCSPA